MGSLPLPSDEPRISAAIVCPSAPASQPRSTQGVDSRPGGSTGLVKQVCPPCHALGLLAPPSENWSSQLTEDGRDGTATCW